MNDITVIQRNNQDVVDSRIIAAELDISHRSFIRTIKKYATELQAFGQLGFEIATVTNSVGAVNQVTFCYLNEDQATFVMTLSRNTGKVVKCKMKLVQAFKDARKVTADQSEHIRLLELQNEMLGKELTMRQLDHTMITMHGKETVLALRGMAEQIVREEIKTTEVVEPDTGRSTNILTANQLKEAFYKRTGHRLKSMKQFTDKIRQAGRDDLLEPVRRSHVSEYVKPELLDEAIAVVCGSAESRQLLLGE